ncbi:hypothetical protein [Streptomyces daliensis]|uniref:Secreted protein n=1 Tax=Streptomyces daliensis TaxID=299421 RepID=A0A8T4J4D0_9ACTN|nr:hypothetical protein [Streptomyces daliensis]
MRIRRGLQLAIAAGALVVGTTTSAVATTAPQGDTGSHSTHSSQEARSGDGDKSGCQGSAAKKASGTTRADITPATWSKPLLQQADSGKQQPALNSCRPSGTGWVYVDEFFWGSTCELQGEMGKPVAWTEHRCTCGGLTSYYQLWVR